MHRPGSPLSLLAVTAVIAIATGCGVPTIAGPFHTGDKLIKNGSFETSSQAGLEAWQPWPAGLVYGADTQYGAVEGKTALRVDIAGNGQFRFSQTVSGLVPGASYLLRGFVRTHGLVDGNRINAGLAVRMEDGTAPYTPGFAGTSDWQSLHVPFTLPPDSKTLTVELLRSADADAAPTIGAVWFDDISLRELTEEERESFQTRAIGSVKTRPSNP